MADAVVEIGTNAVLYRVVQQLSSTLAFQDSIHIFLFLILTTMNISYNNKSLDKCMIREIILCRDET